MPFNTQRFVRLIDLSSEEGKTTAGNRLVEVARPLIDYIIENVPRFASKSVALGNNNFDLEPFSFEKDISSGLTGVSGLYLIINRAKQRFYLGGASNLAQRKGEHNASLRNPASVTKLALSMRNDLNSGTAEDFYFVPILTFTPDNVKIIEDLEEKGIKITYNQQVASFLDNFVERPLLETYLTSSLQQVFYNVKTTGKFEKGNTFGGAPNSGEPPNAICYKGYAWESVSAAANTFKVDRRLIRIKRDKGIMAAITTEKFNRFDGVKITNADALEFSKTKPQIYNQLLNELFPTVARKRVSDGEP